MFHPQRFAQCALLTLTLALSAQERPTAPPAVLVPPGAIDGTWRSRQPGAEATVARVDEDGVEERLSRVPAPAPAPAAAPQRAESAGAATDARAASTDATASVHLAFERVAEPNERAFTCLVPKGWSTAGGIFNVNPIASGGPGNSLLPKCDFQARKDAAGSVYLHWLPTFYYADFSRNPQAVAFPRGSRYQGMEVQPMPAWHEFLLGQFQRLHPDAQAVTVIQREAIPALAEVYRTVNQAADAVTRSLGLLPMDFQAGGLVLDYTEGGTRYRQALITALVDNRGAAFMWSNESTLALRAPAAEADRWRPTFEIMRQSVRFEPRWLAQVARAAGERGQAVLDTLRYLQRADREIFAHRARTHTEIRHEGYLLLTGQEDYVNPYTQEVETDTNEYQHRWTTRDGQRIYTNDRHFDPNRVREYNNVEWKSTPVRAR